MLSLPPAIFFDACDLVNPLAIATAWGTGMPSIISCRNLGCLAPTVNAAYLPIVLVQRFSESKGLWISTSDLSRYKSGLHADAFCLVVFPFFAVTGLNYYKGPNNYLYYCGGFLIMNIV